VTEPFSNRVEAGRRLAARLVQYAGRSDVIVLGLPRGGVPVAAEVARELGAPLDVFLVRKLGVPGHPEFAMGAIAESGHQVLDEHLVDQLNIPRALIDRTLAHEHLEIERQNRVFRDGRGKPDVQGKTVIVVDDGLATGATMLAALTALREGGARSVVAAAPVGAPGTIERLRPHADAVVCVEAPPDFDAVGRWYVDFSPTTDGEVKDCLTRGAQAATS